MSHYTYILESAAHGYHSEWGSDRLPVAREIQHDLNEELHDAHVVAYDQWVESEIHYAAELQAERENFDSTHYDGEE